MLPPQVRLIGVPGIPEVRPEDDLADLIWSALSRNATALLSGDVVVVAQKVVSKAESRLVELDKIEPSALALQWAKRWGRDARLVEVVLQQARRIVRMDRGRLIVETHRGYVCANAGVDTSNVQSGFVSLLPEDCDRSASELRRRLMAKSAVDVAVIISDTFGRPWRVGLADIALGIAGLNPMLDYRGRRDTHGNRLTSTLIALADELASAAELVMGKLNRIPAVVIRGVETPPDGGSSFQLIRSADRDLFR